MSPLLSVHDLAVAFDAPSETAAGATVRAVDGVSLQIDAGETLALVGESGSGKTLTALSILRLIPPAARIESGRVFFLERNLLRATEAELRKVRGRHVSMIFQDPLSALHPMLPIGRQLGEVLEVHEGLPVRAARERAAAALGEVGLPEPERSLSAYPHELSGGMRQRVMIAMALLCRPKVLLADEPTTAVDVTIQAQILELLKDLQRKHGMAILLITHDLGIVAGMADRVQVLYCGRTVEESPTRALFREPLHPYTLGLLASVPRLAGPTRPHAADDPFAGLPKAIPGQPPDAWERPEGCAFHPRCALVTDVCRGSAPELQDVRGEERRTACFEVNRLRA